MKRNEIHKVDSPGENLLVPPVNQSTYPGYLRFPPQIETDNEFTQEEALDTTIIISQEDDDDIQLRSQLWMGLI